jgi:hypothetical protein
VPAGGGSFDFNIAVVNLTPTAQTFDLWTQIELPNVGTVQILSVTGLSLPGNAAVDRDRTQNVPAFAPAGTYYYYEYIGDYPWVIEDYDYFTFTKAWTDGGGYLGTADDWIWTGEPFEGEVMSAELPKTYALHPSYPNPFNPTTTIRFDLPMPDDVSLVIYDITGRLVTQLAEGYQSAGSYTAVFDGSNLASGIYFAVFKANNYSQTQKMLLVK